MSPLLVYDNAGGITTGSASDSPKDFRFAQKYVNLDSGDTSVESSLGVGIESVPRVRWPDTLWFGVGPSSFEEDKCPTIPNLAVSSSSGWALLLSDGFPLSFLKADVAT